MMPRRRVSWAALCVAVLLLAAVGARADFVTIGNPGNAADTRVMSTDGTSGYGAVPYTYQISETAVSITEWAAFYTASNSGKVGSFNSAYNYWNDGTRTVGTDAPAVYISFNQVAQYCNWLTTGNATQGAYTINASGAVTGIMSRGDILATGQQYYLIPTEDEWYKAAYYKPDDSGYSLYADGTSDTNNPPTQSTDGSTGWNYYNNGYAIGSPNYTWTVGSGTEEQNGTFSMMGNVWEWNEALISGQYRGLRGGTFGHLEGGLRASSRYYFNPADEYSIIGFRVASIIPEPASATMLLMGAVGLLLWRRRRTA